MVWSLALRSDDAKQDPVVYGTKFGVVFLAEGPRTASIERDQNGLHLITPYQNKTSLGLVFSPTVRVDSQ